MFGRKRVTPSVLPDKAGYTRYYEHDGMLRAYANRSMLLAMLFGVIALTSLGFAIYVRLLPPTIIRVDRNGDASIVGGRVAAESPDLLKMLSVSVSREMGPTDVEGRATVRRFLENYLSYTPTSVDKRLADALNMMTQNLRQYTLGKLREEDTVGKVQAETITSRFQLQSIEPLGKQPWTYLAFGTKEVHRVQQQVERTDRIVARYTVRLIQERRSERNPSGLLVAEYREEQMVGQKDFDLRQKSSLLDGK